MKLLPALISHFLTYECTNELTKESQRDLSHPVGGNLFVSVFQPSYSQFRELPGYFERIPVEDYEKPAK